MPSPLYTAAVPDEPALAVPLWGRSDYTLGGPPARVALLALTSVALPDPLPVSRRRHGIPASPTAGAPQLSVRTRVAQPAWFEGFASSGLLDVVREDLGDLAAASAGTSEVAYEITADVDEPEDLGYLQAAWAIAVCIAEQVGVAGGELVVIDPLAGRAWTGAAVASWSPQRRLDVTREVAVVVEDGGGTASSIASAFTRGACKLGRADLVLSDLADGAAISDAANLLRMLLDAMARGDLIDAGDRERRAGASRRAGVGRRVAAGLTPARGRVDGGGRSYRIRRACRGWRALATTEAWSFAEAARGGVWRSGSRWPAGWAAAAAPGPTPATTSTPAATWPRPSTRGRTSTSSFPSRV